MPENYSELLQQQHIPTHLAEKAAAILKREIEGGKPRTPEEQAIITDAWHCFAEHYEGEKNNA